MASIAFPPHSPCLSTDIAINVGDDAMSLVECDALYDDDNDDDDVPISTWKRAAGQPTPKTRSTSSGNKRLFAVPPAPCLSRSLSNRSSSSNSSVTSSRSVRFALDTPRVRYTYPKEVYDRAPIQVAENLALKRCKSKELDEEEPLGLSHTSREPDTDVTTPHPDMAMDTVQTYDCYGWRALTISEATPRHPVLSGEGNDSHTLSFSKESGSAKGTSSHDILLSLDFGIDSDDEDEDDHSDVPSSEGTKPDETASYTFSPSPASTPTMSPAGSPEHFTGLPCPSRLLTAMSSLSPGSDTQPGIFVQSPTTDLLEGRSHQAPNFIRWDSFSCSCKSTSGTPLQAVEVDDAAERAREKRKLMALRLKRLACASSSDEDTFGCLGGF